ncbi:MAG: molybdate ABC transporter permease subunit, partial [Pontibacterium sp.]
LEAAAVCGASPFERFVRVVFPLAKPGFIAGGVLGFAHTVGEFGLVLMIGGSLPDETRVVSIAIYEHVEALEWQQAHWLSGGMLLGAFVLILVVNLLQRRQQGSFL